MKKILLISPPVHNERPIDMIPVGLLSIAGYLRKNGYAAMVYNCSYPHGDSYDKKIAKITSLIQRYEPDFLGLGFPSGALDAAVAIARSARSLNKGIRVIVGGIHPSARPRETISMPDFDVLVQGEGEITTRDLLDALSKGRNLKHVRSIFYKNNGRVVRTDPRPEIDDLDAIPFDNRDLLFGLEQYPRNALGQIHTSRGCAHECAYCSSPIIWKRKVRFRSVGNVIAEIEYLHACYRVNDLNFADDNFTSDQHRVAVICEEILKRKLKVRWRCCSRPDIHQNIGTEVLRLMRRAGCTQICVGFESGDQRLLDNVDRHVRVGDNEKVLEAMKRAGIRLHVDFIIGLPGESKETLEQTFQLMQRLWRRCRPTMTVALFKPYPGTRLGANRDIIAHKGLHAEFRKIFDFAETCNIKRLSRDPSYIARRMIENISTPGKLSVLMRRTVRAIRAH